MRFPPAWYPDPTGRHDHRWWDGVAWTAHVADAGRPGSDPLPAAPPAGDAPSGGTGGETTADRPTPGPTTTGGAPGAAVAALAVGLSAALLGWVPFLGLAVAITAIVLVVVARGRTAAGRGRGMVVVGGVAGGLGLVTAIATTWIAVLLLADGTGGRLGTAARDYVTCLESAPQDVCERRLTEDLLDAFGG